MGDRWNRISFDTTAEPELIIQSLQGKHYPVANVSVVNYKTNKVVKKKMSDLKQILIIWGLAIIVMAGVVIYFLVNTGGM